MCLYAVGGQRPSFGQLGVGDLDNLVYGIVGLVGVVGDSEHGHVSEQVNAAYVYAPDVEAEALLEVLLERIPAFGPDELNAVVLDELDVGRLQAPLAYPDGEDEEGIGQQQLNYCDGSGNGVDDRERDDDKEVGHLSDRHGVGAVAHDGEYTEETDAEADARLGLEILQDKDHEEYEEEDRYRDDHKGEVEVTSPTLGVVETVHDDPVDDHADGKAYKHGAVAVGKGSVE